MKILAVSDEKSKYYFDFYTPGKLEEFDLILSCGDLSRDYLEFLVTMARCPLIYVRGNHDDNFTANPPEGCICIEDQIYVYNNIRILGLGGCFRYKNGKNMYTEIQMKKRIRKLRRKLKQSNGFDILLTHAAARGINDGSDPVHQGFECFVELLDVYSPKYMVHGHMHINYGYNVPRQSLYKNTTIINAFGHYIIDYKYS